MYKKSERRGRIAYVILAADVVVLVVVLGLVLQAITTHAIATLGPVAVEQQRHWGELAADPCVAAQSPPVVPKIQPGVGAWGYIANLVAINRIAPGIWTLYTDCQEPITEVITEDLLHFKVNMYDKFESPPEPAYAKICSYVDKNLPVRSDIYIVGHTDDTFTDEYNFELSYKRALHVMAIVRSHLDTKGLNPGVAYRIFPLGMGKSQLLKRNAGESLDDWRRRCRRIELSFRSRRGTRRPEVDAHARDHG